MNDGGIRTIPLGESGSWASGNLAKLDAGDNSEEGIAHLGKIRLKLILNIDNESGCDRRKKTSLSPGRCSDWDSNLRRRHCKRLTKINVVSTSSLNFLMKSLSNSSDSRLNNL